MRKRKQTCQSFRNKDWHSLLPKALCPHHDLSVVVRTWEEARDSRTQGSGSLTDWQDKTCLFSETDKDRECINFGTKTRQEKSKRRGREKEGKRKGKDIRVIKPLTYPSAMSCGLVLFLVCIGSSEWYPILSVVLLLREPSSQSVMCLLKSSVGWFRWWCWWSSWHEWELMSREGHYWFMTEQEKVAFKSGGGGGGDQIDWWIRMLLFSWSLFVDKQASVLK